jgi:NADPH-dependent glutamate synthase beta subunit-like oxidoreductase
MEVDSETDEVHEVRKAAIELLLSDHLGDCLAPCHFACPAHMDVPLMLRQINRDELREAIVTVKRDIAFPAVLGRICPKPCEKGCRRAGADGPVAVCELKRYVADVDLASDDPYLPDCEPDTEKRVAVVGAGPTGLAAAYRLRRHGHAVTVIDAQPKPGGRLRTEFAEQELPSDVLDAEIEQVMRTGVEWQGETRVGVNLALDDLVTQFDAVLLAWGAAKKEAITSMGLKASARGIHVKKDTFETSRPGVFAAGNAIRTKGLVVRSVADGKEAAIAIEQYLAGETVTGRHRPFSSRMGRVEEEELGQFLANAGQAPRQESLSSEGLNSSEAIEQAGRCLHCDCRGLADCKLKRYAEQYGADPNRYKGERAKFRQINHHSEVIYEPGKCIDCGLCIEIVKEAGEPLGLAFVGRGFDVRIGIPFNRSLADALGKVAAKCVAACPTSALVLREEPLRSELPILGQW